MLDPLATAKKAAAQRAVEENFNPSIQYVGIGSGSTVKFAIEAISNKLKTFNLDQSNGYHKIVFVSTGSLTTSWLSQAGFPPTPLDSLRSDIMLDVVFDGADEVDEDMNCIKGGGACLFQEKLVASRSKRFICVADSCKRQPRLLTSWPHIPVEVVPIAVPDVLRKLNELGSVNPHVRLDPETKTPVLTDQKFYIIDAPFAPLTLVRDLNSKDKNNSINSHNENCLEKNARLNGRRWEVAALSTAILAITGVLEVGIFTDFNRDKAGHQNKPIGGQRPAIVYYGDSDGIVTTQVAPVN